MKRVSFIAVVVVLCFGMTAQGVTVFSDDFGDSAATPAPAPPWTGGPNGVGPYTGTGHLQLDTRGLGSELIQVQRSHGPAGNFVAQVEIDNFQYYGDVNGQGVHLSQFQMFDMTSGGPTGAIFGIQVADNTPTGGQLQFLPFDNGAIVWTGFVPIAFDLTTTTDIDFRVTYAETMGGMSSSWLAESRLNNGSWVTHLNLDVGVRPLDGTAFSKVWMANAPAEASMDLDNYNIVPEPATVMLLGLGGLALIRRRRA